MSIWPWVSAKGRGFALRGSFGGGAGIHSFLIIGVLGEFLLNSSREVSESSSCKESESSLCEVCGSASCVRILRILGAACLRNLRSRARDLRPPHMTNLNSLK